ncbi:cadg domain containing protein [Stylonychia lemnae]|uniref:Cadg domain containing protein n=1 Tax=Stylonychia lemnae TaxID=5949 RepID=A0A078ASF1_STYLE|nr:cadg domain containing protein [Stylonychia lemnae]|eukprot:CDW83823.1 cadg domain containing protein [Stylonychia lemnae]
MHVIQSNQDSDNSPNDKEDWIALGGHSQSQAIVQTTSNKRAFMALLQYIAGLKWAYYDQSETLASIASCKFASNGLQVVFLTTKPMHIIVIETLTGSIINMLKTSNRNEQTIYGLESRIQSNAGVFLGYQSFNGEQPKNWVIMEFNQTSGQTLWAMYVGTIDSATQLQELAYTGVQNDYERLYLVGRNGQNQNMIASIDSSIGRSITKFQKIYTQNSPNFRIKHVSVKQLTLAMCGDDGIPVGTVEYDKVWASFATITKSNDNLNYQRDYQFNHPNNKYCGGVFTDAQYLYVLVISDRYTAGHYQAFIYKKDIVQFTDNHLKAIDLSPSTSVLYPIINTFQVKAENGKRTFFFSGSTDAIANVNLNKRTNFVQKFTFDATTYSCIAQNNYDSLIGQFLTNEGSTSTFIGSTQALGLWVDSSSNIINGVSFDNLTQVDYQNSLKLDRIKYFPKSHDACQNLPKTTTMNKILEDQTYYVSQSAKYYRFETFNQIIGNKICSDITFFFFAELKQGTELPSFIKFDGSNRIFQVFTNLTQNAKSYDIKVTGYPSIGEPTSFYWTLNIKQNLPPKFSSTLKNAKLYYYELKRIQLPEISLVTDAQVFISVTLHDKLYLPQWIDYDPTKMQISFNPNSSKNIGQYDIDVILTESISFLTTTVTFTAFVVDKNFNLTDADKYQYFDVKLEAFNDGLVTLMFSTILVNYNSINLTQSLQLRITGDAEFEDDTQIDDGVASPYSFTYTVLNINQTNIDFQLYFDNPSQIGLFRNPDYINVKFLNNKTFLGEKLEVVRNTSLNSQAVLPRLIKYQAISVIRGTKLNHMIRLILLLQFMEYLPLLNLNLPTFLVFGFSDISYYCFSWTRQRSIYRHLFEDNDGQSFGFIYRYIGIQSKNFLNNIGDIFLITSLLIFIYLILYVMSKACQNRISIVKYIMNARDLYNLNSIILYLDLLFFPLMVLGFKSINLGKSNKYQGIVSFFFALTVTVIMLCFFALCIILIFKKFGRLNEGTKKQKYGSLYQDLKTDSKVSVVGHQFQLFRSLLLALTIVYLDSYPKIQTSAIFSLTTILQLYYLIYQPYEKGLDNIISIINESTLLVVAIFYFFFSDMTYKISPKMTAGWYLIFSYTFIILVNGGFIIYKIIYDFRIKKGWIKQSQNLSGDSQTVQIKPEKGDGVDSFNTKEIPNEIDESKKYKRRRSTKVKNQDDNVAVFYDQSPNQNHKQGALNQQQYKNVKINESNITDMSVYNDQRQNYVAQDIVYQDLELDVEGGQIPQFVPKSKQTLDSDRNVFSTNDVMPITKQYFRRILNRNEDKISNGEDAQSMSSNQNQQQNKYIRANPRTVKIKSEFKKKEYKDD